MQVEWYGQSAFRLSDGGTTVFIDPFDDLTPLTRSGRRWDYPAIEGVEADLLLVTHEHLDHNGVEAIGGEPVTLRSTAGRLESPVGEVDLLFVPIGDGPTIGAEQAHAIARRLKAKLIVPMHYRTEHIDFLEPVDAFAQGAARVETPASSAFDVATLPSGDGPLVVVPRAPGRQA
jgi:L-ascorbate metabolism protein UlaG (beta-lactamase superfamily)